MFRNSIEVIVKEMDIRQKHNALFDFGGHTWATPIVKKLLSTFEAGEVEVTIGEKNSYPVMIFKWKQGDAFIYCADASRKIRKETLRGA